MSKEKEALFILYRGSISPSFTYAQFGAIGGDVVCALQAKDEKEALEKMAKLMSED